MQRSSYLTDYEKSRGAGPGRTTVTPATTKASASSGSGSLAGDVLRIDDAYRAIERIQKRIEEVERHNLSLNENVKNCAHLIQLTQSFAEEQGHEQAKEVKQLGQQLAVVVEATTADRDVAIEAAREAGVAKSTEHHEELARRMDQLQNQMKELVALKMTDAHERESEMSGFQSEILRQNSKFEAAMTEMTKRHAEVLYAKLDEDARELVAEKVQAEVNQLMGRVGQMAESTMGDLREKYDHVQSQLSEITKEHDTTMASKIDSMETDVDSRCARLEQLLDQRLAEMQNAEQERDEMVSSMRKQLKGNDDALGKSIDMLQVRYESTSAEIERLSASLREVRVDMQEQCSACATACERTSASSASALEKLDRSLALNRDELEAWVADELDSGLKSVAEKEAVRFQALCRSVDERMLAAQQEIQALGQSHVSSICQLENSLREEVSGVSDRAETRHNALVGEIQRAAENSEVSRQQLAEEMNAYHTSAAARTSELERRMIEAEVTTEQTLARRVEEAASAHKADVTRVEERLVSDMGACEQRLNGRLDDCFTQLNSSLEMYKHMRTLCKDTASSTKQTEEMVAKQFTVLEGSIESRFEEKFSRLSVAEQAMAAAAAGKGVLKFSPNKPKSRRPSTEETVRDSWGEVQPFGINSNRRPSSGEVVAAARNAAECLAEATATTAKAATAVSSNAPRPNAVEHGAGRNPETGVATMELESSIRDLQGIVANLAHDGAGANSSAASPAPPQDEPTRREASGATSSIASTRAVQSERYSRERQERQARLQNLYAELNKT